MKLYAIQRREKTQKTHKENCRLREEKMRKIIIPAVIAKTQEDLNSILDKISGHAPVLQLDIMDGRFVPNQSLDFDFSIPEKKYHFEAHLMIENPERWVEGNWKKVDTIIAHFETVKNPAEIIKSVKKKGKRVAFALIPETNIEQIKDYLMDIDQVLIMTVHPGFYGSKFLPETMDKIKMLRELRPDLDIEVDGGIKPDTIEKVNEAGANMFVSGSYLIRSDNIQERIQTLKGKVEAEAALGRLSSLGIDLDAITEKLQSAEVASFAESFDSLLNSLKEKRHALIHGLKQPQVLVLGEYKNQVEERLKLWKNKGFNRRLWAKDHTLWFSDRRPEITDRLGWLELPEMMHEKLEDFKIFAEQVKDKGLSHIVLFGMGGSSLAPEVFQKTFGNAPKYPELIVLDSTHPSSVRFIQDKLDLHRALFLISSKSGTTLETLSLFRYFWKQMSLVTEMPGDHFVAITDPGTPLMKLAQERSFRRVFQAPADVGGRYSAFTDFGLVPAALIGMDIHRLLDRAWIAAENSAFCVSEEEVSGLILGASLGELNRARDKLTFLTSASLRSVSDWLEQLIAESTGKDGKGIVPVANEPWVSPNEYGEDRFFACLSLEGDDRKELDDRMEILEKLGHPSIRINLGEKFDLGEEMFRWEIAVAAAGSVLGIHPFNQPDVQLAKDLARKAMERRNERGKRGADDLETLTIDKPEDLARGLKIWIDQAQPRDYIALQAFLFPNPETTAALQNVRFELLKRTSLATTLGYGPRFLHSTGQLHKGGPNTALILQIIDEPETDLSIPETDYSFGALIKAQAEGDYHALKQRGRRVIRINLKADVQGGLRRLQDLMRA